jgi:hypothetical protein
MSEQDPGASMSKVEIASGPDLIEIGSHDGEWRKWNIRVDGRERPFTAKISGTALSSQNVPGETAQAIRDHGKAYLDGFIDRGEEPPSDHEFTTGS